LRQLGRTTQIQQPSTGLISSDPNGRFRFPPRAFGCGQKWKFSTLEEGPTDWTASP
jgi:hypothetical protein